MQKLKPNLGLKKSGSPSSDSRWVKARKLLCIRLDSIGDVLMTTPAIRALKESHPGREITLLTSPSGAEIGRLIPEVHRVISYEAPWMKASARRVDSAPDLKMIERLRREKFDAAVIFTVFSQNPLPAALMAFLADIPLRLAYSRENPYQLLTDWLPDPLPDDDANIPHEVRRQLDLVGTIGSRAAGETLSIAVSKTTPRKVLGELRKNGLNPAEPWIVIHPGATAPSRRYRLDGFAAAAQALSQAYGIQIVFTGRGDERVLVEEIQRRLGTPSISMVDEFSLEELAALLEISPLLLSNNTGPVHIAAAVGTPTVVLYALTNSQHTPWGVPSRILYHDVPCKFCYKSVCPMGHHNCLRLVHPGEVVNAVLSLLEEASEGRLIEQAAA